MEELILGDAYRPLDQVMLASHALLTFGTDEQKADAAPPHPGRRARLVPAVQRARRRQRPGVAAHPGRARRRRVARHRAEDLVHRRAVGRHGHAAGPHRPDRRPPRRHHRVRHPDGPAGHRGPPDPGDHRPRGVLRGVPRRRARSAPSTCSARSTTGGGSSPSGLASERAFVGANAIQLQRMFDDLVALARAARLPDGTTGDRARGRAGDAGRRPGRGSRRSSSSCATRSSASSTTTSTRATDPSPSSPTPSSTSRSPSSRSSCSRRRRRSTTPAVEVADRWYHNFLWGRAMTISGGSSEIMRGLVGRQLLGLPELTS